MVTRVYGTANSTDVNFSFIEGDLWQVEVPTSKDGIFIMAIYAENDIGNKAFICKALFAITGHQMKIYILEDQHEADISMQEYRGSPELDEFRASFLEHLYESGIAEKLIFTSQPLERGYTLGYLLCERVGS